MTIKTIPTLLLLLLLVIAGHVYSDDLDRLRAASDSAHQTIPAALRESNAGKLVKLLGSDAALISPTGSSIQGRLTIRAMAALLLNTIGAGRIELKRQTLNIIDHTGYETGRYTVHDKTADGKALMFTGRYTVVWREEENTWRIGVAIAIR